MGNFINKLGAYQVIPRDLIFDNTLSDRARFVYCYMASKPNNWEFLMTPMAKEIGYSVDTLRKYINELIESGWLIKGEQKNDGLFGAVTYILNSTKISDTEKIRHGEKPTQHNIDNRQNTDSKHKEEIDTSISKKDTINYAEILLQWKKINPNLKQPRMIDEKRKKAIRTLLKNNNATIEDLYKAFKMISISSFCNANHEKNRKWEATFDWVIKDTNGCFNRLLEGQFALTDTEKTLAEKITNGEWDESFSSKITSSPYHPYGNTSIMYDEINHCYMYIAYSYSMIADGYTDDERPDGAVLVLNSGRGTLTWSKADRRWIHKK